MKNLTSLWLLLVTLTGVLLADQRPDRIYVDGVYYNSNCTYSPSSHTYECDNVYEMTIAASLNLLPNTTRHLIVRNVNFSNVSATDFASRSFPQLRSFCCERCKISVLNQDIFDSIPNLEILDLSFNNISSAAFTNLESLHSLATLNLSHNVIVDFQWPENVKMSSLSELDLSYNRLSMLPEPSVFENSSAIRRLDLSHNNLSYIHPAIFKALHNLSRVDLEFNRLESVAEEMFLNTSINELHFGVNPWHCHCGISWLMHQLHDENPAFKNKRAFKCSQPEALSSVRLMDINDTFLHCEHPDLVTEPFNTSAAVWHTFYLHCNASGYPSPSIYWEGPRGVLAHKSQRQFLPSHIHKVSRKQSHGGYPTFRQATVTALKNGSLMFVNFRLNYVGNYTCHAANPLGIAQSSAYVNIHSDLYQTVVFSAAFGVATAFIFLLLGIVFGAVRMCYERVCRRRSKNDMMNAHDDATYEEEAAFWDEYFRHPLDSARATPDMWPSPVKCITPAEPAKNELSDFNKGISNTLDAVRSRLRDGMGRHVENMRERANHMRETGKNLRIDVNKKVERARYKAHLVRESAGMRMSNFRESSSQTLRSIRSSSGQYAHRVREGMVERVEAVKYSVKSIKDMCGTGMAPNTMTIASVSTNVDSQETEEVCRTVTFV